jgi:hypothetical protein
VRLEIWQKDDWTLEESDFCQVDVGLIRTDASEENRFLVYRVRPLRHHAFIVAEENLYSDSSSELEAVTTISMMACALVL